MNKEKKIAPQSLRWKTINFALFVPLAMAISFCFFTISMFFLDYYFTVQKATIFPIGAIVALGTILIILKIGWENGASLWTQRQRNRAIQDESKRVARLMDEQETLDDTPDDLAAFQKQLNQD